MTELAEAPVVSSKSMESFTAKFLQSSDEDFAKLSGKEAPAPKPPAVAAPPVAAAPPVVPPAAVPEPLPVFPADLSPAPAPVAAPPDPVAAAAAAEEAAAQDEIAKFDPKVKAAIMKERQKNKELRDKLAELETAPAKAVPTEELEALKTQLAEEQRKRTELEEQIGQIDLAQSPAFKAEFDNKVLGLKQRAAKELVKEGVTPSDAARIVETAARIAKPSEREAFLQEQAAGVSVTLLGILAQADDVLENRQVAIQNWRATKMAQQESASQNTSVVSRARIQQDVAKAIDTLRQEKNGFYMESPSDQAWNQSVKQRVALLEGVLQRQNPEQIVRLVADGITSPMYRQLYSALLAQHEALKAEVAARDSRNTPFSGSGWAPPGPAKSHPVPGQGDTIESLARTYLDR